MVLALPAIAQVQFNYTINSGAITITGYTGSGGAVTIPDAINGLPVTSIGSLAFIIGPSLTSVTIPNSVTNLGDSAFDTCTSLTSVTIPSSVTNVGAYAFSSCFNLRDVYFRGNAPSSIADSTVFDGDNNVTVYYLPGTTGWSATLAGVPAVLWNPQVQTRNVSFGVRANQFGFSITGTSNIVVVVEGSTNLANPIWYPLQANTLTGSSLYFSDPDWTNYPARFYRLRSP
jgi:hypothetical protein